MKNRIISADLIRICAIFLIIIIHLKLPDYFDFRHPEGLVLVPLIQTCVPLFIMLSGALLLGKSEPHMYFFKKRLTKVIFPWILWTSIFSFIILFYNHMSIVSFPSIFRSLFISMFWIMPIISILYMLTPSLRIYIKHATQKDIWLIIFLWFIGVSVLPYAHSTPGFPLETDNGMVRLLIGNFGYFLLGYALTLLKPSKKYLFICILLLPLSLVLSYVTYAKTFIFGSLTATSPGTVLLSAILFALFYFQEKKLRNIVSNRWKTLFAMVSEATLGVFFIHFLFLNYPRFPVFLKGNQFHVYPWLDPFLNGLVIYTLSVISILLLQKFPKIGKYAS